MHTKCKFQSNAMMLENGTQPKLSAIVQCMLLSPLISSPRECSLNALLMLPMYEYNVLYLLFAELHNFVCLYSKFAMLPEKIVIELKLKLYILGVHVYHTHDSEKT